MTQKARYSTDHLPITKSQVRSVQIARRKAGYDDETYKGMLAARFNGITSTLDLTRGQATELLLAFGRKMPPKTRRKAKPTTSSADNISAMITPPQRALIDHLVAEIPWHAATGYDRWLEKRLHMSHRPRTKEAASTVIEGLKGLKQHSHDRTN